MKWLPAVAVMIIIFLGSTETGAALNKAGLGPDIYHIGGHFVLFTTLCLTYYKATKNIALSILLTILFGISDELHQRFTPGRSSSFFDVEVDTVGALFAGGMLWKLLPILPKRLKNLLNK